MRITFIGHAAILVDVAGTRILSDPWWQGPCFGAQWWVYPDPYLEALTAPPDFVYISHGHNDHLHPGTLARLPKSTRVLVSKALDLAAALVDLGFTVIELPPREQCEVAPGVKVEIAPTYADDTLMAISDGTETCLNINDALHAAPAATQDALIDHLRRRYGRVDYVFCGYGTASHFPNCYVVPGKDDVATAVRRQRHFNTSWATIIHKLSPRFAFPFAADVVLLEEELFWSNAAVHNVERPLDAFRALFPDSPTEAFDIAPGFIIADGEVMQQRLVRPLSDAELRRIKADEIATANNAKAPTREQVVDVAAMLERNLALSAAYLREFRQDYRMLIALRGATAAIEFVKRGDQLSVSTVNETVSAARLSDPQLRSRYDLIFLTRFSYLRRALTSPYGFETIFVGSGGLWYYRDRAAMRRKLHRELAVLLRHVRTAPPSRFGDQSEWLYHAKEGVKRLLGHEPDKLYDLAEWTVFADEPRP
jgi:L-ascorbate metabolism protein UlaG (beta-lactamase superfamily)